MTRDEFKKVLTMIETFYQNKAFITSKDAFNNWYDLFKDEEYEDMVEAVKGHAKSVEFLPNPANLNYQLRLLKERRRSLDIAIGNFYDLARNAYPGGGSAEAKKLFYEKAMGCENPIEAARYMQIKICKEISDKPLEEYIREVFA